MVIPFPIVTSGLISVEKKIQGFWSLTQSLEPLFFNKAKAYSSKQTQYCTFLKILLATTVNVLFIVSFTSGLK